MWDMAAFFFDEFPLLYTNEFDPYANPLQAEVESAFLSEYKVWDVKGGPHACADWSTLDAQPDNRSLPQVAAAKQCDGTS